MPEPTGVLILTPSPADGRSNREFAMNHSSHQMAPGFFLWGRIYLGLSTGFVEAFPGVTFVYSHLREYLVGSPQFCNFHSYQPSDGCIANRLILAILERVQCVVEHIRTESGGGPSM
jgi:hypothetical protein